MKPSDTGKIHRVIGAFFDAAGRDDYPFDGPFYRIVYTQLQEEIEALGGMLLILRHQDSYLGQNVFRHAWRFVGQDLVPVSGPVRIDLIWNKGHLKTAQGDAVVNDPSLDELCTDKWRTYRLMPDLHPRTWLLNDSREKDAVASEVQTTMVVAKPVDSEGGAGVLIGTPATVLPAIPSYPYLLQEFIDTSGGIAHIVEGMHDLRILSIRGVPALCYVRTPPLGEMTANVSRGGREIEVPLKKIPGGAMTLFGEVDRALEDHRNRLYTADMGLDADGHWKLFELNTKPGFSPKETGPSYRVFYRTLAQFLLDVSASPTSFS